MGTFQKWNFIVHLCCLTYVHMQYILLCFLCTCACDFQMILLALSPNLKESACHQVHECPLVVDKCKTKWSYFCCHNVRSEVFPSLRKLLEQDSVASLLSDVGRCLHPQHSQCLSGWQYTVPSLTAPQHRRISDLLQS